LTPNITSPLSAKQIAGSSFDLSTTQVLVALPQSTILPVIGLIKSFEYSIRRVSAWYPWVGDDDGEAVAEGDGAEEIEGTDEKVGACVGLLLGRDDGNTVGDEDGRWTGADIGTELGYELGAVVPWNEGEALETAGAPEGASEGSDKVEGAAEGEFDKSIPHGGGCVSK
jgi:hypothetical protein